MAGKIFIHQHTVYFNETNAMGGVAYFSNYIKWQGIVREEYFIKTVPAWREIMQYVIEGKINMITVEEHSHFIRHIFFGDTVTINLQTANIKKCSFDMIFVMVNNASKQIIYEGIQRLAFDDFKGKFIPIPEAMLVSVRDYETKDIKNYRYIRQYLIQDRETL